MDIEGGIPERLDPGPLPSDAIGESEEQIREAVKAIQAVKDSGAIYLTWANHYAKQVSGLEGTDDFAEDVPLDGE